MIVTLNTELVGNDKDDDLVAEVGTFELVETTELVLNAGVPLGVRT
jgi:hypothetical protein